MASRLDWPRYRGPGGGAVRIILLLPPRPFLLGHSHAVHLIARLGGGVRCRQTGRAAGRQRGCPSARRLVWPPGRRPALPARRPSGRGERRRLPSPAGGVGAAWRPAQPPGRGPAMRGGFVEAPRRARRRRRRRVTCAGSAPAGRAAGEGGRRGARSPLHPAQIHLGRRHRRRPHGARPARALEVRAGQRGERRRRRRGSAARRDQVGAQARPAARARRRPSAPLHVEARRLAPRCAPILRASSSDCDRPVAPAAPISATQAVRANEGMLPGRSANLPATPRLLGLARRRRRARPARRASASGRRRDRDRLNSHGRSKSCGFPVRARHRALSASFGLLVADDRAAGDRGPCGGCRVRRIPPGASPLYPRRSEALVNAC
jgi:hypothetical protein